VHWKNERSEEASIALRTETDRLFLSYSNGPEDIIRTVALVWTPCRFGGARPYFLCPGADCGRRVVKLYFQERDFLCRHCHRLAYAGAGAAACEQHQAPSRRGVLFTRVSQEAEGHVVADLQTPT
jgi:hypothetical protein